MGSIDETKEMPFFYWEEYIIWLNEFCMRYSDFDNHFFEREKGLSSRDVHFINDLNLLFHKIEDYAKDNYLEFIKVDNRESYFIFFDDSSYEIGKVNDSFYCSAVPRYLGYSFINFDNVISGKRLQFSYVIDKKLEMLSEMIDVLYSYGIPVSAISERVDSKVKEINVGKVKKRIR